MSYLDIDTLLSEEERVPSIFQSNAKNLAFLDSSLAPEVDLPQGAKIELPLWLAIALSDRNMVRIEIPKQYGSKMRDELMADASSINLRELSYYFFDVGLRLSKITRDDDLLRTLRVSFCGERFRNILVRSFHGSTEDSAEFKQSLTAKEYKIYNLGLNSSVALHEWRSRAAVTLHKSSLLRRRSSTGENDQQKKRQAI